MFHNHIAQLAILQFSYIIIIIIIIILFYSKLAAQLQSIEIQKSIFAAFIDVFRCNTYVMISNT